MWLLLAAGCVSTPYPSDRVPPLPDAGTNCVSLTGSFENFGIRDDGDRVVMAELLFPVKASEPLMLNYERLAVTRLSIAFPDESSLDIQGWVEDELLYEQRLTREEFECRERHLVLRDSKWGIDGIAPFLPILYRSSVERLLSRAEDGSLIIENHEFSGGALTVVPIALKARYWFKFDSSPATRTPAEIEKLPGGTRLQFPRLQVLRPPDGAPDWSGYRQATDCLARVGQSGDKPMLADSSLLGGRRTQAFLLQGSDGQLLPSGIVREHDWLPATHDLRIEKQHREALEIADRYVECLLGRGYRWDTD